MQFGSFQGWPFKAECTQTHNNGTLSLTFTKTKNELNLKLYKSETWKHCGNNSSDKTQNIYSCTVHHHHHHTILAVHRLQTKTRNLSMKANSSSCLVV